MQRRIYIIGAVFAGIVAGLLLPMDNLVIGLQLIGTALSIQIAAVFVRLNRGMPTLTWSKLTVEESEKLTADLVTLTKEYIAIIAANGVTLVFALALIMAHDDLKSLSSYFSKILVGTFSASFVFCVMRIGYVIWRDYDIVKLQKTILDLGARREAEDAARKEAESIIAKMAAAGQTGNRTGPAKPWMGH